MDEKNLGDLVIVLREPAPNRRSVDRFNEKRIDFLTSSDIYIGKIVLVEDTEPRFRVKALDSFTKMRVFSDEIRKATPAEIHACRPHKPWNYYGKGGRPYYVKNDKVWVKCPEDYDQEYKMGYIAGGNRKDKLQVKFENGDKDDVAFENLRMIDAKYGRDTEVFYIGEGQVFSTADEDRQEAKIHLSQGQAVTVQGYTDHKRKRNHTSGTTKLRFEAVANGKLWTCEGNQFDFSSRPPPTEETEVMVNVNKPECDKEFVPAIIIGIASEYADFEGGVVVRYSEDCYDYIKDEEIADSIEGFGIDQLIEESGAEKMGPRSYRR